MRFSTKAIHAGQEPDPATKAIVVPIYQAVNYAFDEVGKPQAYEYSRAGNPTRSAYEECLASLEEAKFGLAFSSGMAATDAVVSVLRPGDHVVSSENVYGGTYRLFEKVCVPRQVGFTYVDNTNSKAFEAAIQSNTRLIWVETPANPLLQLTDIRAVAQIAKNRDIPLASIVRSHRRTFKDLSRKAPMWSSRAPQSTSAAIRT